MRIYTFYFSYSNLFDHCTQQTHFFAIFVCNMHLSKNVLWTGNLSPSYSCLIVNECGSVSYPAVTVGWCCIAAVGLRGQWWGRRPPQGGPFQPSLAWIPPRSAEPASRARRPPYSPHSAETCTWSSSGRSECAGEISPPGGATETQMICLYNTTQKVKYSYYYFNIFEWKLNLWKKNNNEKQMKSINKY